MGKNVYIRADNMTEKEERIGDFRGWRSEGDVFMSAAEVGDPEQERLDHEGYSYYPGPYVAPAATLRAAIPEACAMHRKIYSLEDDDPCTRVHAFVELYERLEKEGRNPTLWVCM